MKSSYILIPVFLLLVSACSAPADHAEVTNKEASLPESFKFSEMGLKVINSSVNPEKKTMSTLYGNEKALTTFKNNTRPQTGEVLALVTWNQKDDVNWYGAKIPAALQSVEMIKTNTDQKNQVQLKYQYFAGSKLILSDDTSRNALRISYILDQKPSVLP